MKKSMLCAYVATAAVWSAGGTAYASDVSVAQCLRDVNCVAVSISGTGTTVGADVRTGGTCVGETACLDGISTSTALSPPPGGPYVYHAECTHGTTMTGDLYVQPVITALGAVDEGYTACEVWIGGQRAGTATLRHGQKPLPPYRYALNGASFTICETVFVRWADGHIEARDQMGGLCSVDES